jgi:hypothetical protein
VSWLSDALKLLGTVALVVAGFLFDPVAGFMVLGSSLVLAGWLMERNGTV